MNAPAQTVFHMPRRARGRSRRAALLTCVFCLAALALVVVCGVVLAPESAATDLAAKNLPPTPVHPFGTDQLGRDMLVRTLAGLSTSIGIGCVAALASALVALVLGCASALGGRRVDAAVTWLVDLATALPHIVLLILVSFALGKGFTGVVVGIALTHWPGLCRVVRAEVLQARVSRPVAIAGQLGCSRVRIAICHILPAVMPQFLTGLVLLFPHAILHEAAITFLGFGLPVETAAIGIILSDSMGYLSAGMWWLALFPGAALVAAALLFTGAAFGLRRVLGTGTAGRRA